nr:ATP-binding protein [uncultured Prevotella sp.]
MDIQNLIGEATAYNKKQQVEAKRPKSWLKSVSAFANGEGGMLIFGINEDNQLVGLQDAEQDAEIISEAIKAKLDPIPIVNLEFKEAEGKKIILLHVASGDETPYYYIGDKQRVAYVRIGNESTVADRAQLRNLVLKGSGKSYDSLPAPYRFEDMSFSKLKSVHLKRLGRSFEDNEFISWGIIDAQGKLTNAGVLLADDSPVRQSRIFCTRWDGLDMTNGLGEALDDAEFEGSVIGQLQDAVAFVQNNSHKKWWKEADYREELPDYPKRAVSEVISNAIIHRTYLEFGSEIHIDMYDNRMEVYSPGGMMDGRLIQQLDPMNVPSKKRNPLLADFFNRLALMERRGSGMKKIMNEYKRFEKYSGYRAPEFNSNSGEFHVTLWNLNYVNEDRKEFANQEKTVRQQQKEFANDKKEFANEIKLRKEFVKAQRVIYKLISLNPKIRTTEIAETLNLSTRQVQKYMKRLTELKLIIRTGNRLNGAWKILDSEYEDFFEGV